MRKFNEWLGARELLESSLGLKRRERVARAMAKRYDRTRQVFPNTSDSRGHEAIDKLERDVQATAGRFDLARRSQRERSAERLQRIAVGDKEARRMQMGPGNVDKVRANLAASDDSERMLRAWSRPDLRHNRAQGKDQWWMNGTAGLRHTGDEDSPIGRASADLLRAKREKAAYMSKAYGGKKLTAYDRNVERTSPGPEDEELTRRQARLDDLMNGRG